MGLTDGLFEIDRRLLPASPVASYIFDVELIGGKDLPFYSIKTQQKI